MQTCPAQHEANCAVAPLIIQHFSRLHPVAEASDRRDKSGEFISRREAVAAGSTQRKKLISQNEREKQECVFPTTGYLCRKGAGLDSTIRHIFGTPPEVPHNNQENLPNRTTGDEATMQSLDPADEGPIGGFSSLTHTHFGRF